jgi:hypothetical protein
MIEVQASICVAKGNGGASCPAPPLNKEEESNPKRRKRLDTFIKRRPARLGSPSMMMLIYNNVARMSMTFFRAHSVGL